MTAGISRRAYAKRQGISEAAVRKHIREGTLADAMLPDGTIAADVADRLLAKTITRGAVVPIVLRTAKQRRLRAQVRQQGDELAELNRTLIRPEDADRLTAQAHAHDLSSFRQLPGRAAAKVAGKPAKVVLALLRDAVNDTLRELSDSYLSRTKAPYQREELNLDGLTPVALASLHANQQAEKLEIERAVAHGRLILVRDAVAKVAETLAVVKSRWAALPSRVALFLEDATVEQATAIIAAEVEAATIGLRPTAQN